MPLTSSAALASCLALSLPVMSSAFAADAPSIDLPINSSPSPQLIQARQQQAANAAAALSAHAALQLDASLTQVTSCADDNSPGTLRVAIANAYSGTTIDLTKLTCSRITLGETPATNQGIHTYGLTIKGPGADKLAIYGIPSSPYGYVFNADGDLTIEGLTIRDGHNYGLFVSGGCVDAKGTLTLIDTVVEDCMAEGKYATGGGVSAIGVVLTNSTVSGNQVRATPGAFGFPGLGGGVYATNLVSTNSIVSGNSVVATGRGVHTYGGGIAVRGPASISGTTITGNSAEYGGGGLSLTQNIYHVVYPATISNSTITANSTDNVGGAMISFVPTAVHNSTIAFNTSTGDEGGAGVVLVNTADIESTIIADNQNVQVPTVFDQNLGVSRQGSITGNHNLITSSNVTLPGDTILADPLLRPLFNYGGLTPTYALMPNSPAIDAGSNPDNLQNDQRGPGYRRVIGSHADIGAFESQITSDTIFVNDFAGTVD
jgi:hypothetical protein